MKPLISLEDHYVSPSLGSDPSLKEIYDVFPSHLQEKLHDLGPLRLADMDAGSLSLQVISHGPGIGDASACRSANDFLAAAVTENPLRFAGFATLPMHDPAASAAELERCVKELNFVGALVDNHLEGRFYDDEFFWPLFGKAEELGCVIYIHPTFPSEDMQARYRGNYGRMTEWALGAAGWGWHAETGNHILRLFAAGVFDKFPKLRIVIGHMGELLPYQLDRIAGIAERGMFGERQRSFKDVWDSNIWVTTSGMFSLDPLACLLRNTRIERILYSVDYPFSSNETGLKFMEKLRQSGMVTEEQLEKIAHKNAEDLLGVKA